IKSNNWLIISFIFIVLTVQSCGPAVIKMDKIPEMQGGSPLSTIDPITFVINNFEDKRRAYCADREFDPGEMVAFCTGVGYKGCLASATLDRKPVDIVKQAITNELKRNGHNVLEMKD